MHETHGEAPGWGLNHTASSVFVARVSCHPWLRFEVFVIIFLFFLCIPKLDSVHSPLDLLPDWCAQWAPSAAVQNWHYQRCKVRNHSLIIFSRPRGQEVHQLSSARRPAVQTF